MVTEFVGLGAVLMDSQFDWYRSEPIAVPVLGGVACRFIVSGYDDDPHKEEFHAAIRNFLSIDERVLKQAESPILEDVEDCNENWNPEDEEFVSVSSPGDVWSHIRLGTEPAVSRRGYGDKGIYISLECGCDWEPEHGLQIVFKNGLQVNKVGPYDGHLTNSDAYAREDLEHVIYPRV